jgi:hypothetical protein
MTFPIGAVIPTANLDSADDDPNAARIDLLALVNAFNALVASANQSLGIPLLTAGGQIENSQIPTNWNVTGSLTFQPSSKIVNIRDVIRMTQRFVADMALLTDATMGDIIFLVDGDAGQPCLSVYDGTAWKVVRLMTTVGSVAASITTTSSLTAEAD